MDSPQQNYFLIIPCRVMDDPQIDDATAILFGRIMSLSNNKQYCFASDEYLANLTKCKLRTLQYRLKKLKDRGHIKIETKKKGMLWDRRIYPNLNYEPHEDASRSATQCASETHQVAEEQYKNNNNKKERESRNSVPLSEHAFGLSDFLFSKIKESNEKFKKPNREKWALEIDRMNRLDGYSWEDIKGLIEFAHSSDFWKGNIHCPATLRKQATKLTIQMKTSQKKSPIEEKSERMEESMKYAEEMIKKIPITKGGGARFGKARAWDTWCEVRVGGNWIHLPYTEHGFREQFVNLLRKGGHI